MADWFKKMPLLFDLDELAREIEAQESQLTWQANQVSGTEYSASNDGRYHDGQHGTRWCHVKLSSALIDKIEQSIGSPVYRDVFYLWDYQDKKSLPLHLDTAEINCGKAIAVCIPLVGRFKLSMYRDYSKSSFVGDCIYGPGELILINNRKYFHEGEVLDQTRLSIHFFLELENVEAGAILK